MKNPAVLCFWNILIRTMLPSILRLKLQTSTVSRKIKIYDPSTMLLMMDTWDSIFITTEMQPFDSVQKKNTFSEYTCIARNLFIQITSISYMQSINPSMKENPSEESFTCKSAEILERNLTKCLKFQPPSFSACLGNFNFKSLCNRVERKLIIQYDSLPKSYESFKESQNPRKLQQEHFQLCVFCSLGKHP